MALLVWGESVDPVTRAFAWMNRRGLWRGVTWGIAASAIFDGAIALFYGNQPFSGPSYSLLSQWPGMRVVGGLMVLIGLGMLFLTRDRESKKSLVAIMATFVFSVWIMAETVLGWGHAHRVGAGTLSKWFLFFWLSIWLAVTAAGPSTRRGHPRGPDVRPR